MEEKKYTIGTAARSHTEGEYGRQYKASRKDRNKRLNIAALERSICRSVLKQEMFFNFNMLHKLWKRK